MLKKRGRAGAGAHYFWKKAPQETRVDPTSMRYPKVHSPCTLPQYGPRTDTC